MTEQPTPQEQKPDSAAGPDNVRPERPLPEQAQDSRVPAALAPTVRAFENAMIGALRRMQRTVLITAVVSLLVLVLLLCSFAATGRRMLAAFEKQLAAQTQTLQPAVPPAPEPPEDVRLPKSALDSHAAGMVTVTAIGVDAPLTSTALPEATAPQPAQQPEAATQPEPDTAARQAPPATNPATTPELMRKGMWWKKQPH